MNNYKTLDSEWNYAAAYMQRIDELFRYANAYKTTDNYQGWFKYLLALHDELLPQMKENADKKLDEKEISKDLRDKAQTWISAGRQAKAWDVHKTLSRWEEHLRNVMKERGMDLPRKLDPGSSLLQ